DAVTCPRHHDKNTPSTPARVVTLNGADGTPATAALADTAATGPAAVTVVPNSAHRTSNTEEPRRCNDMQLLQSSQGLGGPRWNSATGCYSAQRITSLRDAQRQQARPWPGRHGGLGGRARVSATGGARRGSARRRRS